MDCDLHEVDACVCSVSPGFILVKVNVTSVAREEGMGQNPRRTVKRLVVAVGSEFR